MRSKAFFLALAVVAGLHLVGLGRAHVIEPDEGRYADVARSFLQGGSWVVASCNGVPFLDKPPLVCWLGALSLRAFGLNALALRLVPALAGIAAALVAAGFAEASSKRGAWAAALLYGTAPLAVAVGRTFTLDVPLTALTSLGAFFLLRGAGTFDPTRRSHGDGLLAGLAIGLATLVKGPVAIGLAGLAAIASLLLAPTRRIFSPLPWLVALAVAAPWYAAVCREEPEFARAFFLEENLRRFAGAPTEHIHGPLFFPGTLAWGLGAGALVLLVVLGTAPPLSRGARVLAAWTALVVGFFSLSSTKVETYILPVFPALAAVLGVELDLAICERSGPVWRALRPAFLVACAGLALASIGLAVFGLGWVAVDAEHADLARDAVSPALALLPLGGVAAALLAARAAKPKLAVLALAGGLLLGAPVGLGLLERLSALRSVEPAAQLVLELRKPGEKVASYHFYYRGLPFMLGEPVTLLGELNELRVESFAQRPELYMPDVYVIRDGGLHFIDDCWTRGFLAWQRPLLVVTPSGQNRPARFLDACRRAGVKAELRGERGDDVVFEVLK